MHNLQPVGCLIECEYRTRHPHGQTRNGNTRSGSRVLKRTPTLQSLTPMWRSNSALRKLTVAATHDGEPLRRLRMYEHSSRWIRGGVRRLGRSILLQYFLAASSRWSLPRPPIRPPTLPRTDGLNVWPDCCVVANWLPKFVKKRPEAIVLAARQAWMPLANC